MKWEGDSDVVHGIEPFAHLSPSLEAWGCDDRPLAPMRDCSATPTSSCTPRSSTSSGPHHRRRQPAAPGLPVLGAVRREPAEIATTIIFLDDSTIENGCLWVVPGSHRDGVWTTRTDGDAFAANEVDADGYPDAEAIPVELAAGSTVTFGAFLVHRSAPNTSSSGRRALLYSYQPAGRRKQVDNMRQWMLEESAG